MAEVALTLAEATMAVTVAEEVGGLAAMVEAEAEMAAAVVEVEGVANEEEVKWVKW